MLKDTKNIWLVVAPDVGVIVIVTKSSIKSFFPTKKIIGLIKKYTEDNATR